MFGTRDFLPVVVKSAVLCLVLLIGCAKPVNYRPRSLTPSEAVNCVDTLGHISGNKPFILGGEDAHCYCNPTPGKYVAWRRDGYFGDKTYEEVVGLYREKGYQILARGERKYTNCHDGELHAAQGGKCLIPPVPGTLLYEAIVSDGAVK